MICPFLRGRNGGYLSLVDHHPRSGVDLAELRAAAVAALDGRGERADGPGLSDTDRHLVELGVAAVTTALDLATMRRAIADALDGGVSPEHVVEVQTLVAAIGVHALHEGVRELREELLARGGDDIASIGALDEARVELRTTYTGESTYWDRLEHELPGFLDGLLNVSPHAYAAFFEFCAVPWRHGDLPALTKELVYLAIDATPTHRYGPGFRLHLANCLHLGASRAQVLTTLDIAARAPRHHGVR